MENQFNKKIKCIRTDNAGEYLNGSFAKICKQAGIRHQTTVPYSPQQNGLAERTNRAITERARSILYHMHVEPKWSAEAMYIAAYITNRLPCAAHPDKTPFQICFGKRSNVKEMHVFGAIEYAYVDKTRRKKLNKKAFRCMFPGYSDDVKGYRVWNIDSQRVEITRSAQFQKNPKTQYLDVNYNYDKDIPSRNVNRDDDQETVIMMQPVKHTVEPMDVDDAGFNSPIMNETDADMLPVNQEQAIVPRGHILILMDVQYSDQLGPIPSLAVKIHKPWFLMKLRNQ